MDVLLDCGNCFWLIVVRVRRGNAVRFWEFFQRANLFILLLSPNASALGEAFLTIHSREYFIYIFAFNLMLLLLK